MVGCILSQVKPWELYMLSCEAKNVELAGLYPIPNASFSLITQSIIKRVECA